MGMSDRDKRHWELVAYLSALEFVRPRFAVGNYMTADLEPSLANACLISAEAVRRAVDMACATVIYERGRGLPDCDWVCTDALVEARPHLSAVAAARLIDRARLAAEAEG